MQKILRFVESEIRGLHAAAYVLGFFALLSTLLALFRDRLLASTFGAGQTLDIYYAAFRIPDVVFVSIASLASVFILVPMLTRSESSTYRHELMGNVITAFSFVMLVIVPVLWVAIPSMVPALFPALVDENNTLITLARVLLLQPFLLGLSGILASVTQIHGRYILYAIAPLLYNIGIIFGIVVLYPLFGLVGITYGVIAGAFMHVGIQIPFIVRQGYLRPTNFRIRWRELWSVARVSIPRTVSIASNQLALLVLIVLAATFSSGAISVFSLAFNLQAAPLSIIGASYSVAAFPTLARFFARGETSHFCNQILTASRHVLFWSIPLITLIVVLRAHIVRVVLGSGAFDWADTRLTAAALALFAVSLTAQALTLLFVRGYYAAGDTVKPLVVNIITATGVVVGAYALTYAFTTSEFWRFFVESLLRVEDIAGTEVLMLPLSYTLFAIANIAIFLVLFQRDFGTVSRLRRPFFESFSAAVVAGFIAYRTLVALEGVLSIQTFTGVLATGALGALAGVVAAVVVLYALGNREIREVGQSFHNRVWRHARVFSGGTERGTDM